MSRAVPLCLKPLNTKEKTDRVAQNNKQQADVGANTSDVVTYHSSMISSGVLERESTSEVGDSFLKSETDPLLNTLLVP